MTLELHVWGPAFSLPSIDSQCLAAIAFFTHSVPEDEWVLVASSNPALSPTGRLPALKDGAQWIGGLRNVIDHVSSFSGGKWDPDSWLSQQQKADCTAFSAFIEFHGQPLLDLSLYVSTLNYTTFTRKTLSSILPWPTQYIIPPRIRAAARARTEHLGISSPDLDDNDSVPSHASVPGGDQIPRSLLTRPRETVTRLLSQPEHSNQIKLDALISAWLEPLDEILGEKQFFFSEERMCSLDFMAAGFLALALIPALPTTWLQRGMMGKFPRLCDFTVRTRASCLGGTVFLRDAQLSSSPDPSPTSASLPWRSPRREDLPSTASLILEDLTSKIPSVLRFRSSQATSSSIPRSPITFRTVFPFLFSLALGSTAVLFSAIHFGFISAPALLQSNSARRARNRRLADFGEAGQALAALDSRWYADVAAREQ